jgi:hypothetical protein
MLEGEEMRDTIDMARESGIDEWWDNGGDWRETFNEHLKAFEALVRADEREACAKICDELANDENTDEYINGADWCSVRIRARGETK